MQFGLLPNRLAKHVKRHAVLRVAKPGRPRQQRRITQGFLRGRVEHVGNLRQSIGGRTAQHVIATLVHVAQPQHDRFGFLGIEHQWRQKQAAA